MVDDSLPTWKLAAHRVTCEKPEADRIKAVVMLVTGWTAEEVAEVFQVHANMVRNRYKRYRQGRLKSLGHVAFRGSVCALDAHQLALLDLHLQEHLYLVSESHRQLGGRQPSRRPTPKAV